MLCEFISAKKFKELANYEDILKMFNSVSTAVTFI